MAKELLLVKDYGELGISFGGRFTFENNVYEIILAEPFQCRGCALLGNCHKLCCPDIYRNIHRGFSIKKVE